MDSFAMRLTEQDNIGIKNKMELPFKIIVDSRALTRGHASDFEYSLPETIHLEHDTVMYVNTASVTNTFSATGTQIGTKNHYVYVFEKLFWVNYGVQSCCAARARL